MSDFVGEAAVDDFVSTILKNMNASAYLGIIGAENEENFRTEVYKVKPYKGNRDGETPDWIKRWKPIIRKHLHERWGFQYAPKHLETDDVIVAVNIALGSYAAVRNQTGAVETTEVWVCSPDKDLKQTPGRHFDYKKGESVIITESEGKARLYAQMLMGDTVDNIAGVPKCGPKTVQELLSKTEPMMWDSVVRAKYDDYYGPYYGPIIFAENQAVVQMMDKSHPLWEKYGFVVDEYTSRIVVLS